jgi:hypothetical protein
VLDLKRALAWPFAFGQIALLLTAYVVAVVLAGVTVIAEMSVSPAKPGSNAASIFALELDEVGAVDSAVGVGHAFGAARRAD